LTSESSIIKMNPPQNKTESAGGVVINKKRRVLVVNQRGNSWSLPKGHIEPGEDKLAAAIREIKEESGIVRLTLIKDLGSYSRYKIGLGDLKEDKTELKIIHMFLFKTDEQKLCPTDANHPEARWVYQDDVEGLLTHPKDKLFFKSIRNQLP
jgi:8-oxo-dGTP pyrophosphatase MutT (NUDIX family)